MLKSFLFTGFSTMISFASEIGSVTGFVTFTVTLYVPGLANLYFFRIGDSGIDVCDTIIFTAKYSNGQGSLI